MLEGMVQFHHLLLKVMWMEPLIHITVLDFHGGTEK